MKTAAKIVSFIFHPLLLATYLVLMFGIFFPSMLMIQPRQLLVVTTFVFGFTFVIPVINLLFLKKWGSIGSFQMHSQKERIYPFVFICGIYVLVSVLFFYRLPFHSHFNKFMVLITLLVAASTVLTFFIKVSVHSLAMCGWVGIMLPLIQFSPNLLVPTAVVIVLTGVVISSRLILNVHTPKETWVGCLAGLLVGYGGMIVLF